MHHNVERDLPAAIFPIFEVGSLEWINEKRLGSCLADGSGVVDIVLKFKKGQV